MSHQATSTPVQSILHQVMEGPKVKLSGDDCAAESTELAEQTCEVSDREEMPVGFLEGREDLATNAAELLARHPELHLFGVHRSAEKFLGPKRDKLALLRMNGEAEMMKQIDRLLSVRDGLGDRASEDDNVADVHRQPDAESAEMPDGWSQKLGRQPRGWSQAEGHAEALVLHFLPHEPHGLAVLLAEKKVMIKVADVDLGDVVVATKELGYCV